MVNRKKSREFLMKLLYMDSINNVDLKNKESVKEFYDLEEEFDLDEKYISKMIDIVEGKREILDSTIEKYLSGWNIERLSKMNLAILRLSAAELLFMEDIPEKVSINEAVNLSKEFSEEDSFGFVNSVLDKILIEKKSEVEINTEDKQE